MELLSKAQRASGGDPRSIREYAKAAEAVAKAQTQQAKTAKEAARAQEIAGRAARAAAKDQSRLAKEVEKTTSGWKEFLSNVRSGIAYDFAGRGIDLLVTGLQELIGTAIEFTSVSLDVARQNRSWERSLTAILDSNAAAKSSIDEISQAALRSSGDLEDMTNQFISLSAATKGSSITQQEITGFIEEGARAFRVLGANGEQIRRVFRGVEQALGKGAIQAEEWRTQILEAVPASRQIVASGLDVTLEELNELFKDGKFDAELFFRAFSDGLKTVEGEVNELEKAEARVRNVTRLLQTELGTALEPLQVGGTTFLADVLDNALATANFDDLTRAAESFTKQLAENPEIAEALGSSLGRMANIISGALSSGIRDVGQFLEDNQDRLDKTARSYEATAQALINSVGLLGRLGNLYVKVFSPIADQLEETFFFGQIERARELEKLAEGFQGSGDTIPKIAEAVKNIRVQTQQTTAELLKQEQAAKARVEAEKEAAKAKAEAFKLESQDVSIDRQRREQDAIRRINQNFEDNQRQAEAQFEDSQRRIEDEFRADQERKSAAFNEAQQIAEDAFRARQEQEKTAFEERLARQSANIPRQVEDFTRELEREDLLDEAGSSRERRALREQFETEDEEIEAAREREDEIAEYRAGLQAEIDRKRAEFEQEQEQELATFQANQQADQANFEANERQLAETFQAGLQLNEATFNESQRQAELAFQESLLQRRRDFEDEKRRLDRENAEEVRRILGQTSSGTAPGRATGGPIAAGQAYNVGERGTEPFVSSQNGYILSHNDAVQVARNAFLSNPALAQPYLPDLSPAPGISTSKMEGLLGAIAQNTYPRNSSKPFSQIMRERQSGSYGRR